MPALRCASWSDLSCEAIFRSGSASLQRPFSARLTAFWEDALKSGAVRTEVFGTEEGALAEDAGDLASARVATANNSGANKNAKICWTIERINKGRINKNRAGGVDACPMIQHRGLIVELQRKLNIPRRLGTGYLPHRGPKTHIRNVEVHLVESIDEVATELQFIVFRDLKVLLQT